MKKRIKNVFVLMFSICYMLTSIAPYNLYASIIQDEGENQNINEQSDVLSKTEEESYEEEVQQESSLETDNPKENEEVESEDSAVTITGFELLSPEDSIREFYTKPLYDELIQSFPEKLSVYTEDDSQIKIDVEWMTSVDYESEWEQIVFEAVVDSSYVMSDGIEVPYITVTIIPEVENNEIVTMAEIVLEGAGTEDNPYLIKTVEDFDFVRQNNDAGIYYKLMNDIDLSSTTWIPLGLKNNVEDGFCATFDGNGHKLYNLNKISFSYSNLGIFGYVIDTTIKNLGVVVKAGTQIIGRDDGGIFMRVGTNCIIDNCYVIGDYVTDSTNADYVGILAQSCSGVISNCFIQGYVVSSGNQSLGWPTDSHAGGIIGEGSATIKNCVCYAEVSTEIDGTQCYAGGISCSGNVKIENCLYGETKKGIKRSTGQIYGISENTNVVVENSYYSIENSADANKEKYGEAKTIEELRNQDTYVGWDFDTVWTMNDPQNAGFPMLQSMVGIERSTSKYILPKVVEYSEPSKETILSNDFELKIMFDRDIVAVPNGGVYFEDTASGDRVSCEYSVENNKELYVKTGDKLLNGRKYKLVISNNCIADAEYPLNYCIGEKEFEVSVCRPKFEGDGSVENPYIVSDVEKLNCVHYQPSKNYVLSNDIDASGVEQVYSIGKDTSGKNDEWTHYYDKSALGKRADFSGIFDGRGYTISGIKRFSGQVVNGHGYDNYIGLFSSVEGGIIKNLNVVMAEDCYKYNEQTGTIVYKSKYPYISILVATGDGTISNCTVRGDLYSNQETTYAGLLAGSFGGTIENCVAYGTVSNEYDSSESMVGGLVGWASNTCVIENSYVIADVTAASKLTAGGLVGKNEGTVRNTYCVGKITPATNTGGLIGKNSGTVENSFYDSTISEQTDSDKGTPKTSSAMKSISTYYAWDFVNCWVINSKHNGGYPYLKNGDGAGESEGSVTAITVFDGADGTKHIEYPLIKFLSEDGKVITQYQGDENGVIEMDDISLNSVSSIEVSAAGYGTYVNKQYNITAYITHIIMLYLETNTPTVYCANLVREDGSGEVIDILQKKKTIHQDSNEKFTLSVSATYAQGIDNICIIQGGKIKMNSTGIFEGLSARSFDSSMPIYIQIVGKDGVSSELFKTYLSVSSVSIDDKDDGVNLGFEDIEIEVDSDIPIIGGSTITLSDALEGLEVFEFSCSDGKIKCSVNIESKNETGSFGLYSYDNMKKLLDSKYSTFEQYEIFINNYRDEIKSSDFVSLDAVSTKTTVKAKVFGYIEADMATGEITSGKVAICLDGKTGFEAGFWAGIMPCVLVVDLSASAQGSATVKLYSKDAVWDLASEFKIGISAGVGPGIPKIASLTINGSGELATILDYNTYTTNSSIVVNATTDVFAKLRVLSFEWEKSVASRTYNLYDSNAVQAVAYSEDEGALWDNINEDSFIVGEIESESAWNGTGQKSKAGGRNTDIELLSSVYGNSSPQIVQFGDDLMLLYLHQNQGRSAVNATEVVYSIYDNNTQAWSSPKAVEDDGTADFYPQIIEYAGEVYVTWTNMSKVASDNIGLNEFAGLGSISVAKYDKVTDTFSVCTSGVTGILSNSVLDIENHRVMWISNESGEFLNNDVIEIQLADYDGVAVSNIRTVKPNVSHLLAAEIGNIGTECVISYIYDVDGDYSTTDDHILAIMDLQGNELFKTAKSTITDIEFIEWNGQNMISYASNGRLMILNDYVPQVLINGNIPIIGEYKWISGNLDGIAFEVPNSGEDSEVDIYVYTYNSADNLWNDAVAVTNSDAQITAFDVVSNGVGIQMSYQKTDVVNGIDNTSLHVKTIEPNADLSISNVAYNEAYNKLICSLDINNVGLVSVNGYIINVYDGTDKIYTETVNQKVDIGEMAKYELELETTRVAGYKKNLKIEVLPIDKIDCNQSDNSTDLLVGYPDIVATISEESIGDNIYAASIELCNIGNYATSGLLNVYVYENLVDTISIAEIAAGEYLNTEVQLDISQIDLDNYVGIVKFEYVSNLDEMYMHNNSVTSNVYAEMNVTLGAVNVDDVSVEVGETVELPVTYDALTGKSGRLTIMPLEFSINTNGIANVAADGSVTGVKEGTVQLGVVATDIFGNVATDTCIIKVSSKNTGDSGNSGNGSTGGIEDNGDGSDSGNTNGGIQENTEEKTNESSSSIGDSQSSNNTENVEKPTKDESEGKNDSTISEDIADDNTGESETDTEQNISEIENEAEEVGNSDLENDVDQNEEEQQNKRNIWIWLFLLVMAVVLARIGKEYVDRKSNR